jgi:hypothetical protein
MCPQAAENEKMCFPAAAGSFYTREGGVKKLTRKRSHAPSCYCVYALKFKLLLLLLLWQQKQNFPLLLIHHRVM